MGWILMIPMKLAFFCVHRIGEVLAVKKAMGHASVGMRCIVVVHVQQS